MTLHGAILPPRFAKGKTLAMFIRQRKTPQPLLFGLALAAGVGLLGARPAPAAPSQSPPDQTYTLTILGTLYGNNSLGYGVNGSGQVAGYSNTANSGSSSFHAFLSGAAGAAPLQDLQSLGGIYGSSYGYAVNDAGQVAGASDTNTGQGHAFLSGPNGGPLQDLGTLPGGTNSSGLGVNDSGQVTGQSDFPNRQAHASAPRVRQAGFRLLSVRATPTHAFLSDPNGGPLHDLGTLPGGYYSIGDAVNDSGQVAGSADTGTGSQGHAFLSAANGGALRDLGTLSGQPYSTSSGLGVNSIGQVAGASDTATGPKHAFLSGPNGNALQDLGTLPGGTNSQADSVNDSGQVVGFSTSDSRDGRAHAFLYSNGVMTDLNALLPANSGITLLEATHVSNSGYITGFGFLAADGNLRAFLLKPGTLQTPPANVGPKITVTGRAVLESTGRLLVTVVTRNDGVVSADQLEITGATLDGAAPLPAPISPSPLPTTPNMLAPGHSQTNGFRYTPAPNTHTGLLRIGGQYTDPRTGGTGSFNATTRLRF